MNASGRKSRHLHETGCKIKKIRGLKENSDPSRKSTGPTHQPGNDDPAWSYLEQKI